MPQRDSVDHALLLLSKAPTDKLGLDKLVDDKEIGDDVVGIVTQPRSTSPSISRRGSRLGGRPNELA